MSWIPDLLAHVPKIHHPAQPKRHQSLSSFFLFLLTQIRTEALVRSWHPTSLHQQKFTLPGKMFSPIPPPNALSTANTVLLHCSGGDGERSLCSSLISASSLHRIQENTTCLHYTACRKKNCYEKCEENEVGAMCWSQLSNQLKLQS